MIGKVYRIFWLYATAKNKNPWLGYQGVLVAGSNGKPNFVPRCYTGAMTIYLGSRLLVTSCERGTPIPSVSAAR